MPGADLLARELGVGRNQNHQKPNTRFDLLARELGVGRNTIDAALLQLEKEGVLESCGAGRRRKVLWREPKPHVRLRVSILSYGERELSDVLMQELLFHIHAAGHTARFAS
jgi:DNA-binding FadR family transcriptional regulator